MKGLTLVEILITMGISIVVGMLLLIIIVNSAGLFYNQSSKLNLGLNTNDTLSQIRQSVKEASFIQASFTFGSDTYTSGTTQLVLKVPSIDSLSNIIVNTFDYFIFFQDQKKLRFKTFPDPASNRKAQDQIFSTHVDSLTFKYFDLANPANEVVPTAAKKVLVSLALKQKSGISYETSIATSEANLRND